MATRQSQREQERRARREQAVAARAAKVRRRQQLVAGGVVAAMVLATVGAVVAAVGSDDPAPATTTSTATTLPGSTTASQPTPVDDVALPAPGSTANPASCPAEDGSGDRVTSWPEAPPVCVAADAAGQPDPGLDYRATLHTDAGDLVFLLNTEQAPLAVNDFVTLARSGYLDGAPIDTVTADAWFEFGGRFEGGEATPGAGYTRPSEAPEVGSFPSPLTIGLVPADPDGSASTGGRFLVATGTGAADLPLGATMFGLLLDGTEAYPRILRAGTESGMPGEVIRIEDVTIEPIDAL